MRVLLHPVVLYPALLVMGWAVVLAGKVAEWGAGR